MKNFTKMKTWLMLMVMSFMLATPSVFADGKGAELTIAPDDLNIGLWPVGGWQEAVKLTVTNSGTVKLDIKDSDLDDPNDAFSFTALALPYTLNVGDDVEVGFSFVGEAAGVFEATYVASFEENSKSVVTSRVSVESYMPNLGDIYEMPFDAATITFPHTVAIADIQDNYNTPVGSGKVDGTKDAVYKFTLTTDDVVAVSSTNVDAVFAIYAADFGLAGGPMANNAIVDGATISKELFAGDYYLVASCNTDFDVLLDATNMPVPAIAFDEDPMDAEADINPANVTLTWDVDEYAYEYQVLFGTEYPPTEVVMDWAPVATSYNVGQLDNNTQYFWQVNLRNSQGVATGDVWGFTTSISVPMNVVATVADTNDVTVTWDALTSKAFLSYNIFRDGVMLNTAPLTTNEFVEMDLPFNMVSPGYAYTVTAVYDEGESDHSAAAYALINCAGTVNGVVTELLTTGQPIAGATVTVSNTDNSYTTMTDAVGAYEVSVMQSAVPTADDYTITVSATDFSGATLAGVEVACDVAVTNNFELDEFPYAPATVIAVIQDNEEDVLVSWTMDSKEIQKFQVFRYACDGTDEVFLGEVLSGSQFIDNNWGDQVWGEYKYGVKVVYTNATSAPTYSDCLDKDMFVVVDVTVTTNSSDPVTGTAVTFTNVDEAGLYPVEILEEDGMFTWTEFRRGTYDITVVLDGFEPLAFSGVVIEEDTEFNWELIELLPGSGLLYVTPVGMATWVDPNNLVDVTYFAEEGFDGTTLPTGWTMESPNAQGWFVTDDGSSYWTIPAHDGNYVCVNDDGLGSGASSDDYLYMPAFSLVGSAEAYLEFDSFFNRDYGYYAEVLASIDGGTTWDIVVDLSSESTWMEKSIDLSAYLGQSDVRIAFRYFDNGSWAYGWAVDNVKVAGRGIAQGKEFLQYTAWHEGQFAADVDVAEYQYGSQDALSYVPGTMYFAEVANEYTTGYSNKISTYWTYQPCENFDGNADLAAYYVEGTTSNMVEWTALAADFTIGTITYDVMGTNVYRNGEMLAFVAQGTDMYTDADMTPGTYEYCTEVVYTLDNGAHTWTSCSANCVSDVVVPEDIFGQVSGLVYDAITMDPLENAKITLFNDDVTLPAFFTDADGLYSEDIVIGTYDYLVEAEGYIDATLEGVVIAYGTPVPNDFAMNEFPYPVSNVHAEELSDTKVNVTWGEVAISEWLTYSDGSDVLTNLGSAADHSIEYINKFPAESLSGFDGASLTKVKVWKNAAYTANTYVVRISQGDDYTELYSMDVTDVIVDGWNEFTLATPIVVDPTQTLWVGVYYEALASQYCAPASLNLVGGTDGDWFKYNDGALTQMAVSPGIADRAWMLEAYVTTDAGKSVAIGDFAKVETKDYSFSNAPVSYVAAEASENGSVTTEDIVKVHDLSNAKELMGYNVYRTFCDDSADWQFLGYTLDTQFTDNAWGTADWGMYKWVVEAVYTNAVSEGAFSVECIDKDMNTVVNMTVSTTSGDSPSGTNVVFVNTLEELEDITTSIPGSGEKTIDPFRKGTYDITVAKTGFVTIELEDVVIHDTTDFVWELVEDLAAPGNLYVTPTGLATWSGIGGASFEPFTETFDDASSFDNWEVVVGGSSADSWFWNDGTNGQYPNTLDGTPYAFVDSDDAGSGITMDEMLISPVINASAAGELYIMFDQFYNNLSATEQADVAVFDGSEWVTVLEQAEDHGAWDAPDQVVIDVTEYANADFRVRFHYVAPGWDWHWAVDNVVVTNEMGKSGKAVVEYLVYHDETLTGNTEFDVLTYQYGMDDAGLEVLVSGETYLAEVATAYNTGISGKAAYTWTYLPCDSFPAYAYANAENVEGSNDVLVNWSSTGNGGGGGGSLGDFEEGFEAGDTPAGWVTYDVDGDGYIWDNTAVEFDVFEAHTGLYCMTSASYRNDVGALTPDNWLVSPQLSLSDESELSLWVAAQDASWSDEQFYIMVSTTGNEVADFTEVYSGVTASDVFAEVVVDLSDYADEMVYIAIVHADVTDMFFLKMDDFKVTNTYSKSSSAPAAVVNVKPTSNATPFRTTGMSADEIDARLAITPAKQVKSEAVVLGTNIYRDAELIAFVPVADTFYMDMDLMPGLYDYCIATVYTMDDGVHTWESCEGENCITDVVVPEDCIAPTNLVAQDLLGDGYTATLTWGSIDPMSEWLFYDTDAMTYTGIGAEASDYSLIWAVKFAPDMLEDYAPGYVTKISVFQGASVGDYLTEARVMSGDGMNVLYAQDVTGTLVEGWNEIELDEAVAFDNTENLWVGFYVERPGGTANEPTSAATVSLTDTYDYFAYNGAAWTSIQAQYGIAGQSFMVRGFITNSAGKSVALGHVNTSDYTQYTTSTSTGVAMIPADPNYVGEKFDFGTSSKAFLGYNIYRDGTMIEENWPTTGYSDDIGSSYEVCYTVTANYEFCGESDASNEACVTPGVGVGTVENNISVYPNPAKDYVTVEASSDILTIKVTNYMGQVISYIQDVEVTSHTIATSSYSSGVYFVEVETANGVEKVIYLFRLF